MPVEVTTNIPGLNQSYPLATDNLGEGDDHLRLLKRVLKTTFPQIDKPIVGTSDQINAIIANPFPFPVGGIIIWSGSVASIPSGWTLCNGVTVPRSSGTGTITPPDLRDRFVAGAGGDAPVGEIGGSAYHNHTIAIGSTTLTLAQIPAHKHTLTDPGHKHTLTEPAHTHTVNLKISDRTGAGDGFIVGPTVASLNYTTSSVTPGTTMATATTGITMADAGGGTGHTHTASSENAPNIPPYYALAYIMKI